MCCTPHAVRRLRAETHAAKGTPIIPPMAGLKVAAISGSHLLAESTAHGNAGNFHTSATLYYRNLAGYGNPASLQRHRSAALPSAAGSRGSRNSLSQREDGGILQKQ